MFLPLTSVTLYSLLLVFAIAIDYNPLVTNGTCYFKAGQQMADEYSPCGNAALSNYWCCQLGDACASENACFNFGTGTTYLAGCTDSNYEDVACPDKGLYSDQQWTGLVRCFVSDDYSQEEELWASCEDDEQPLVVASNLSKSCQCDKNNSKFTTAVVFTAGPGLVNFATLPEQKGKSIMWAAGMTPSTFEFAETATSGNSLPSTHTLSSATSISSPSFSGNLSSTSTLTSRSPDPTPPNSLPTSNTSEASATTSGLSKGATAGIIVGIVVGVLGSVALCLVARRLPCLHKRGNSSDAISETCCYSGGGSQFGNKGDTAKPLSLHAVVHSNRNDTANNHLRSDLAHGNSTPLNNFDGSRSPQISDQDNTILVSPTSQRQMEGSNMYVRDGGYTSQQSPSSLTRTDETMYHYQPYRPEHADAQRQLDEIAELPACEKILTEDANYGGHNYPVNNSNEETQYFIPERGHSGTEKVSDPNKGSPTQSSVVKSHEVHELPG